MQVGGKISQKVVRVRRGTVDRGGPSGDLTGPLCDPVQIRRAALRRVLQGPRGPRGVQWRPSL